MGEKDKLRFNDRARKPGAKLKRLLAKDYLNIHNHLRACPCKALSPNAKRKATKKLVDGHQLAEHRLGALQSMSEKRFTRITWCGLLLKLQALRTDLVTDTWGMSCAESFPG